METNTSVQSERTRNFNNQLQTVARLRRFENPEFPKILFFKSGGNPLPNFRSGLCWEINSLLLSIHCPLVSPRGRPQTYKPPRHRYGQKHFYCGHAKEIKIARAILEQAWLPRTPITGRAVRLDICACSRSSRKPILEFE